MRCPCGSAEIYDECCGRFHRGDGVAATAEALMRSRFSAFAVQDEAYLLATWHPSARPDRIDLDASQAWTALEILSASGGPFDREGVVEFRAHYRVGGRRRVLHERSRFVREGGRWLYVDGVVAQ